MTVQSKTVIKSYFQQGDKPNESQFADLIDSYQDSFTSAASVGNVVVSAGNPQVIQGPVGYLLTSNGSAQAPSFQVAPSSGITGLTGVVSAATGSGTVTTSFGSFASSVLAAALTDETGTGSAVFSTNPTIVSATVNQPNIVGVTTNSNAAAGSVGEYISSGVLLGGAINLGTGTAANVTSISLTAGDWNVQGNVAIEAAIATSITTALAGISTTTATIPTTGNENNISGFYTTGGAGSFGASISFLNTIGPTRLSLSGTTTVYLVARAAFSGSTCAAYGFIGARRVR